MAYCNRLFCKVPPKRSERSFGDIEQCHPPDPYRDHQNWSCRRHRSAHFARFSSWVATPRLRDVSGCRRPPSGSRSRRSSVSTPHGCSCDKALTLEPGPGYAGKAVTLEPAYDIDYLLIAPPRHPLGKKRRVQPADLTKYPLVVPHQDTYSRHLVDQMLR
jgi:hypothetical protein